MFPSVSTTISLDSLAKSPRRVVAARIIRLAVVALMLSTAIGVSQQGASALSSGIPSSNTAARAASKKFSAGWAHACVLREDGFPVCWGGDSDGGINSLYGAQIIGDSSSDMGGGLTRMVPTSSTGAPIRVNQIAAGGGYSCLLDVEGGVRCWGSNTHGQLGIGSTQVTPGIGAAIPLGNVAVQEIVIGGQHRENNDSNHLCVLLVNGTIKCWGNNAAGQLGLGTVASPNDRIGDAAGEMAALQPVDLGTGVTVSAIANGYNFTCVIASGGSRNLPTGSVLCWGENANGQLGIGSVAGANAKIGDAPGEMGDALVPVNLGAGRSAVAISASSYGACVLRDNSTVICWGSNFFGDLGQDMATTVKIGDAAGEVAGLSPINFGLSAGESIVQIASGFAHHCAVTNTNRIKCWGYNDKGQLGQGNTTSYGTNTAPMSGLSFIDVNLTAGENIDVVSIAGRYSCIYTSLGAVKCWGRNSGTYGSGALGIGTITSPDDAIGDTAGELGSALRAVNYTATTPVEPTNMVGTGANGSFTITFTAPAATYGAITGYDHQCRSLPSGATSTPVTFSGTSVTLSSVNSTSVVNGTSYRCRIRAFTSSGAGVANYIDVTAGNPLTVTASSHTVTVGASVPTITGTPSVNGVSRTGESCTTTYTPSSPVGSYPTTCSGGSAATYGITYVNGTITVTNPLTVTASSHTLTVGASVPTITGTPSVNGVSRTGESCTTTYTPSSPVGTYPTTCSGGSAATYGITYVNGTITVTNPLTVTASSHTVTVGASVPTITGTPSVNGVSRTGESCTTTYTPLSPVGTYPTTCSGGSAATYSITYVDGTITVNAAPTTTTVAPISNSSVGVSSGPAPSLVTSANQAALEADPGEAVAVINGKKVDVRVVSVPASATPEEELRVAQNIVATISELLPSGTTNTIRAISTSTGVELTGMIVNPDNPNEKLNVPIDSVKLIKAGDSAAVLLTGLNQTNLPATSGAGGALEVTRGGIVAARAYGLPGAETGEIVLMSTPRLLKTFTVSANGTYVGQVPLPTNIAFGSHTLVMATKNAKVSLGIKLVRTRMQFRVNKVISTRIFKNRAKVKAAGGKIRITAKGRCKANNQRVVMAKKPGGCYITVRQAAKGQYKAIYYRFSVSVVKKAPKTIIKAKK